MLLCSYFYSEAFNNRVAVTILRLAGGLDFSQITDEEEILKNGEQINNELTNGSITIPIRSAGSEENLSGDLKRNDSNNSLGFLPVESPYMARRYIVNEKKDDSPRNILKQKKKAYAEQIIKFVLTYE